MSDSLQMLWTIVCQAPLSMGFSRQEYWSGLPFPSPGDVPHVGIKPASLKSPALAIFVVAVVVSKWLTVRTVDSI